MAAIFPASVPTGDHRIGIVPQIIERDRQNLVLLTERVNSLYTQLSRLEAGGVCNRALEKSIMATAQEITESLRTEEGRACLWMNADAFEGTEMSDLSSLMLDIAFKTGSVHDKNLFSRPCSSISEVCGPLHRVIPIMQIGIYTSQRQSFTRLGMTPQAESTQQSLESLQQLNGLDANALPQRLNWTQRIRNCIML